jgi:hypothetical protein
MRGAISPLPQYALMAWCSIKKHRDNFTLIRLPVRQWRRRSFCLGAKIHSYLLNMNIKPNKVSRIEMKNNFFLYWYEVSTALKQQKIHDGNVSRFPSLISFTFAPNFKCTICYVFQLSFVVWVGSRFVSATMNLYQEMNGEANERRKRTLKICTSKWRHLTTAVRNNAQSNQFSQSKGQFYVHCTYSMSPLFSPQTI